VNTGLSAYHSAFKEPPQDVEPCQRVVTSHGIAFAHNLLDGQPPEYADCDVLYAEPPWSGGQRVFERRAGVAHTHSHRALILAFLVLAIRLDIPAVLVSGSRWTWLPRPDQRTTVRWYDKTPVALRCYGLKVNAASGAPSTEVLHELAGRFACVGDPFCGYGNTGRIFAEHGKRYVLSDLDPRCIGYIKMHAQSWI
jgi:hypothetical protein